MKSLSFGKALVLGSMLCFFVPVACGDDETNPSKGGGAGDNGGGEGPSGKAGSDNAGGDVGPGGAGGAGAQLPPGLSDTEKTIECGGDCTSSFVGISPSTGVFIDPCCEGGDTCGLSTTFLAAVGVTFPVKCQAHDQPGELDETCPSPEPAVYPTGSLEVELDPFLGCCRADTGTCGVQVNEISTSVLGDPTPLGNLSLGCIDAAPFFPDGPAPAKCGAGTGGAGGAGGAGDAGGSGSAGEPNGTGGASGGAGGAG